MESAKRTQVFRIIACYGLTCAGVATIISTTLARDIGLIGANGRQIGAYGLRLPANLLWWRAEFLSVGREGRATLTAHVG